jgi:hypothetical protein
MEDIKRKLSRVVYGFKRKLSRVVYRLLLNGGYQTKALQGCI